MNLSKAEEITTILRSEILRGQYRAGERLPSERDLAARFEANRGAIREAIKKLEQLGIVAVKPGGVRIVAIHEATLEVLGHLLDLGETPKPALIAQFLEVLGSMMALSARSAIEKATDDELLIMHEIVTSLTGLTPEHPDYHEKWQELGSCFVDVNKNLVLRLIFNGLKSQFVGRLELIGMHPAINQQHDQVLMENLASSIRNREQSAASAALIEHFGLVKQAVLDALEPQTGAGSRSPRYA